MIITVVRKRCPMMDICVGVCVCVHARVRVFAYGDAEQVNVVQIQDKYFVHIFD